MNEDNTDSHFQTEAPRPVFVGGNQKSGTSLLSGLLARHTRITGLVGTGFPHDEGQFVQDVYMDELQMADMRLKTVRWGYHPRARLTEEDFDGIPDARQRLLSAWTPYFEKPAVDYFVEKTPSNIAKVRFLRRVFPECRLVIITRHPATQALAIRKAADRRALVGLDLEGAIAHWVFVMEQFNTDVLALRDVHVCKYEDLVRSPAETLASVQRYLGVEVQQLHREGEVSKDLRYVAYWRYLVGDPSVKQFMPLNQRKSSRSIVPITLERLIAPTIGKRDAARIVDRFEHRIRPFGYSFRELLPNETKDFDE